MSVRPGKKQWWAERCLTSAEVIGHFRPVKRTLPELPELALKYSRDLKSISALVYLLSEQKHNALQPHPILPELAATSLEQKQEKPKLISE